MDAPELVQHALVVVHDRLDIGEAAEEVGEAGGLEEHGPVGGGARLLHGPGPVAEELVLVRLLLLVDLQLVGGLLQQGLVAGDLGGDVLDLPDGDGDLVVQEVPLFDGVVLVVFQLGELGLNILPLALEPLGVILQVVDLLLGHRVGGGDQPRVLDRGEEGQQ